MWNSFIFSFANENLQGVEHGYVFTFGNLKNFAINNMHTSIGPFKVNKVCLNRQIAKFCGP